MKQTLAYTVERVQIQKVGSTAHAEPDMEVQDVNFVSISIFVLPNYGFAIGIRHDQGRK